MPRRFAIALSLLAATAWPVAHAAPTFNGATGGFFAPSALVVPADGFNLGGNAVFLGPNVAASLHGAFGLGGLAEMGVGAYLPGRYGVFAKFVLLAPGGGRPGIALGGDLRFGSAPVGGDAYLVVTLPITQVNLLVTGGIQVNFGPEAGAADIAVGPVLGAEWVIASTVRLVVDYDSRDLGAGVRWAPLGPLRLDFGLAAPRVSEVGVFVGISLNTTF